MIELTPTYIASQIFILIFYALLASTYFVKNRTMILVIGFLTLLFSGLSYVCLSAWTGLAMSGVAVIRNVGCLIQEKKYKSDKITKGDVAFLLFLYAVTILLTVYTYDGALSLLSVFATSLYTYSVWQKKIIVYKGLGIPTCILWLAYNIYIMSFFAIILESILLTATIIGFTMEFKKTKMEIKGKES